uniref:tryptophan--tRNA ligase n=1 Tax=Eucampia antarctica TaxID=49252 RepID=A0A7S2S216_9STRA|mmetsp:Transcript_29896/g.28774  ORF Transcript_29896/g.28774 Transcript_29896/m.28774 type:complete len:430 (+) Transcript_29896:45-1334(+)
MKVLSIAMASMVWASARAFTPLSPTISRHALLAGGNHLVISKNLLSMSSTKEAASESETAVKKKIRTRRILSGVQPTGALHLGNYLGAIRQWVDMQDKEFMPYTDEDGVEIRTENYFCVVDLHAITMPHDPNELQESTLASAALYLAAGIDPSKSKVFVQSHVPAHTEMAWLLNCITPMNWLERMIQFKDKAKKQGTESVGVGLFTYPILMAADILLYKADRVPVGEDQRQHLELARDIVRRFNDMYCKGNAFKKRCKAASIPTFPTFIEPEAMIVKEGARIMSLSDGTSKMSKSDPKDASRINVLDPPKVIRDKIKRCKTDIFEGIEWDNPERPEATNLLSIYAAVQPDRTKEDITKEVKDLSWGDFKPKLADAIIAHLEPIQKKYAEVRGDEEYLTKVLKDGADSANEIASQTLTSAKVAMGFTRPT